MTYKTFDFRFNIVLFICLLLLTLSGCATHNDKESIITVSPRSAVITLGDTKGFSVTPAGTAAAWSVNGIPGGNENVVGTIDSDGKYTAPADAAAAPEKVVIRAADTTGTSASAIAFLTTFNANMRLTANYNPGISRANTYSSGQKNIAVFKDADTGTVRVYVVWSDNSSGLYKAYFTRSINGGSSFDLPVLVDSSSLGEQFSPAIAADSSGNIYITWEDRGQGDADILFRKYDRVSGFESIKKINADTTGNLDYDTSPSIAINSDEIYITWEHRDYSGDNYPAIYYAWSINLGSTFSAGAYLSLAGRRPSVAMDPAGSAYVVWEDLGEELVQFPSIPTRIKLKKISSGIPGVSLDIGLTSGYNARVPSIAVDPVCNTPGDPVCEVYIVWQRALITEPKFVSEVINSYDIDLAIVDGGTLSLINTTLSVTDSVSSGFFGGAAYPAIAADDSNIYVVWDDWRNGVKDIYFAKSSDGTGFTTNRIVNDDAGDSVSGLAWHEKPGISVADGKAYVIWTDYRNTQLSTTASPNDVYFSVE
ncbi:MAG: hypothetical protein IT392_05440 [Nitrospirae bacterium]|nr:hypothetical protein [Nitrospirota bacterium]